jgi:hypothetical protein
MFEFIWDWFRGRPSPDLGGASASDSSTEGQFVTEFLAAPPTRPDVSILYALARNLAYQLPEERFAFRGSFAIHAWLGDAARTPKDLDIVGSNDLETIDRRLGDRPHYVVNGGHFDWGNNDILPIGDDYPSANNGHRTSCPYIADEQFIDSVQLDWVVEELESDAIQSVTIQGKADGDTFTIPTVVPELELLWKLLWITGEVDRQVKDLFDAALILDHVAIDTQRFARFFQNRATTVDSAWTLPQRVWQLADRARIPIVDQWPLEFPRQGERTKTPLDACQLIMERLPEILEGLAFFPSVEELPLWLAARRMYGQPQRGATNAYADWLEEHTRIEGEFLRHHDRISSADVNWSANELRRWFALYPKLRPGFAESMNIPHPPDFKRRVELHLDLKRWGTKPTAEIRQVLLAN